jgi:inosine-uridine nucleoside N-ribohydrolase
MPRKVVIDTDFGTDVDDAIAVALAMASDEIEVQAFTVVGRQSIYRKQMLENYLALLGKDFYIPPVYAGWDALPPVPYGFSLTSPPTPDTKPHQPLSFPSSAFGNYLKSFGGAYRFNWFGDEGTLDPHSPTKAAGTPDSQPPAGYSTFEAGQQLATLLSQQDIDYIGLGPLTNLYQALINPSLEPGNILIPQMTVMGVHLQPTPYGTGNVSVGVDYNLGSDLVSALYVLNELTRPDGLSPRPISAAKWVTADVTLRTWLNESQLASLAASSHPFLHGLVRMINAWTPIQTNLFGNQGVGNIAFLHDPLTLACTFSDQWCDFESLNLELVLTNSLGLRWIEREKDMPNTIALNCALSVKTPPPDGQTFQDWLVQRLLYKFS